MEAMKEQNPPKKKASKKRAGRPKGSTTKVKHVDSPVQEVEQSRCPSCQSTERTRYTHLRPPHKIPEGMEMTHPTTKKPFTVVCWWRTQCKSCGKNRVDKGYLYKPTRAEMLPE